jgi:4-amino-4-deoxy-L-arabinose transferase-like glycosyltransferase
MTNGNFTTEKANSLSTAARIGWGALIVVTLAVCYFSNLGAIGFIGPDEPRYAWIARDMAETGDWVTPRLYGKPWFEKPVLYYWMAGASFKLLGVSEAAARLPSALCALFATLALAWLAWRVYGGETARWLLLLLPTSAGMIGFSHAAATDMPFSAMVTIAMVCAAVVLGLGKNEQTPALQRTPWIALALFGFFLGLAVLAKGPAAIILCGGAVFLWAIFTKRWRDAFRLFHPVAIASFCATALPWYILCARRNPDFFRVFIIEHNFKRYLTPEFQHIQPFWYYLPVLLVAFFPWLVILISGSVAGMRRSRGTEKLNGMNLLLLCFSIFCVLFFSTSRSKLPGYVLPAIPAMALLLAKHWARLVSIKGSSSRWIAASTGITFLAFAVLLGCFQGRIPVMSDIQPPPLITQMVVFSFIGGLVAFLLSLWKRVTSALFVSIVLLLVLLTSGSDRLWQLDEGLSSRPAVSSAAQLGFGEKSPDVRTFHLRRDHLYSLQFYFHEEIPEWTPADANQKLIFTNYKGTLEIKQQGVECRSYIVFPPIMICGAPVMKNLREGAQ